MNLAAMLGVAVLVGSHPTMPKLVPHRSKHMGATKVPMWKRKERNRRRNKVARAARKRNRNS